MGRTNADMDFTVLENKAIGRNIALYRKMRAKNVAEIAESLGISEMSYVGYERGEAPITVEFIQKVSELLQVDPLTLLAVQGGNLFFENGNYSAGAIITQVHSNYHYQSMGDEQTRIILNLMENVIKVSERLLIILDKLSRGSIHQFG